MIVQKVFKNLQKNNNKNTKSPCLAKNLNIFHRKKKLPEIIFFLPQNI